MKFNLNSGIIFLVSVLLQGCFTGVESTPKIKEKELKKQNIVDTPEKHIMDSVIPTLPSTWERGKNFFIADSRTTMAAWLVEPMEMKDSLAGCTAEILSIDTIPSLTESPEIQLSFLVPDKKTKLVFRTGISPQAWKDIKKYTLPHMIEEDLVSRARIALEGKQFYILPARRIGWNGEDTLGTRYAPVNVVKVAPAAESSPLRVYFNDNEGYLSSLFMTIGNETTSRRNFETLFSLSDPRIQYKHIPDDVWELIVHSKLRLGMTPEEARLALGSPEQYLKTPTSAGVIEKWTYSGGVFLLFEDGILTKFRQ